MADTPSRFLASICTLRESAAFDTAGDMRPDGADAGGRGTMIISIGAFGESVGTPSPTFPRAPLQNFKMFIFGFRNFHFVLYLPQKGYCVEGSRNRC